MNGRIDTSSAYKSTLKFAYIYVIRCLLRMHNFGSKIFRKLLTSLFISE